MAATLVLPTIALAPEEARRKLAEYRESLRELPAAARTSADRLLVVAFHHASQGKKILSLRDAMRGTLEPLPYRVRRWAMAEHRWVRDGSELTCHRPKLGIAPADAERVWLRLDGRRSIWRFTREYAGNEGQTRTISKDGKHVQITWEQPLHGTGMRDEALPPEWVACVPFVPPAHRPRLRRLSGLHLLWEANWSAEIDRQPTPPEDPALLKHIGGDLFIVLDTWDLTDLEMAVLRSGSR